MSTVLWTSHKLSQFWQEPWVIPDTYLICQETESQSSLARQESIWLWGHVSKTMEDCGSGFSEFESLLSPSQLCDTSPVTWHLWILIAHLAIIKVIKKKPWRVGWIIKWMNLDRVSSTYQTHNKRGAFNNLCTQEYYPLHSEIGI